jgi:hypothetical protein
MTLSLGTSIGVLPTYIIIYTFIDKNREGPVDIPYVLCPCRGGGTCYKIFV